MEFTSRNTLLELFKKHGSVSTDTRKIKEGSIFFALTGANFNGNEFALKAIESGAKAAVIDDKEKAHHPNCYLVEDVLTALQNLGHDYRQTLNIPFIGITGTNGKTTTKELLNSVLSQSLKCYATKGNFNNHIGVPLTLLEITHEHEIAIIEMGANKPGDIQELCEIADPTHGIITNVGKAHLEGFGSFEGVKSTKGEMYAYLSKKSAPIFINADNPHLKEMSAGMDNKIPYSISGNAVTTGLLQDKGLFLNFKWQHENYQSELVTTKLSGAYNLENMMAAVAIGIHFNVPNADISKAISKYTPDNNRSQIEHTAKNTLILDAYNANLTSTRAAIENLAGLDQPAKYFILGDMLELGADSLSAHEEIISLCNAKHLTGVYVGEEYRKANALNSFLSSEELAKELEQNPIENHLILIKGSRGIKLESIVELL